MTMNQVTKLGLALAAGAAVALASGCAANTPAYQCGPRDYKSMASCKTMKKVHHQYQQ